MSDPLFVPDQITKVSQEELLIALIAVYSKYFGIQISFNSLGIFWSHIALETGRMEHCHNWNLGNIKRIKGHKYTMHECSEIVDGKEIHFYPPAPETQFNAYSSLNNFLAEYFSFLNRIRYTGALKALMQGNFFEFIPELGSGGYFTAPIEKYQMTFLKLFEEFSKTWKDWFEQRYLGEGRQIDLPYK